MDERASEQPRPLPRQEFRKLEPLEPVPAQRTTPQGTLTPAERAAYVEFYSSFIKKLVRFLVWKGIPLADAAEVAQETMIDAMREWRTIEYPHAWARRVASRKAARKVASLEDSTPDVEEATPLLRVSRDEAAQWEEKHRVLSLLRGLPGRQRQVMAWTFDGYKPAEIAEMLQMTPEAVRSNLRKARRALEARLAQDGSEQ